MGDVRDQLILRPLRFALLIHKLPDICFHPVQIGCHCREFIVSHDLDLGIQISFGDVLDRHRDLSDVFHRLSLKQQKREGKDSDPDEDIEDRRDRPHPEDLEDHHIRVPGLVQICQQKVDIHDQERVHQTCDQSAVKDIDRDLRVKVSAPVTFQFCILPPRPS